MEERLGEVLQALEGIKKELQDIRGILEPKEKQVKIMIGDDVIIDALNDAMKKSSKPLIRV